MTINVGILNDHSAVILITSHFCNAMFGLEEKYLVEGRVCLSLCSFKNQAFYLRFSWLIADRGLFLAIGFSHVWHKKQAQNGNHRCGKCPVPASFSTEISFENCTHLIRHFHCLFLSSEHRIRMVELFVLKNYENYPIVIILYPCTVVRLKKHNSM